MKNLLIILLLPLSLFAQDSIFKCDAYTSYYSKRLKAPILVVYKLYKGGGDCSRAKDHFIGNKYTATGSDYAHAGYDKGHLANSEDFAGNCKNDESTFRYWNCFPQTPLLNRGIWKTQETEVRKLSQNDTLLIMIGGLYNHKTIGNGVYVPDTCWKIVYSYKQRVILQATTFTNTTTPERKNWRYDNLRYYLERKYNIHINDFINHLN